MSSRRIVTVVLVCSLALNLLFIGVIVGRHVFGLPPGKPHFDWMTHNVDAATRKKIRASMREHMKTTRPARRELRQAQSALHDAVLADPYVESDVVEGLRRLREASGDLQQTMHEQMIRNLGELEPAERAEVFRMLMRQSRGPARHGPKPPMDERSEKAE